MARARTLTEADRTEWAQYARAVTPLPRCDGTPRPDGSPPTPIRAADAPPPAAVLPKRPRPPIPVSATRPRPAPVSVGDHPGGIDTGTWQRFRTGKLAAMRRLDLHGMTAQHAYHALVGFLRNAHADRLRCVEVVTGRGSGEGSGRIRREFPIWLNLPEIRPMILAATHPHAANPGAVRLLLRRVR